MRDVERKPPSYVTIPSHILGALTLLFAFSVFATYWRFKRLRSYTFQVFMLISSIDVLLASATVLGPMGNLTLQSRMEGNRGRKHFSEVLPATCVLQATVLQFTLICSPLLHAFFAAYLWQLTAATASKVPLQQLHSGRRLLFVFTLTVAIALVFVAVMWLSNAAGIGGDMWCFIDSSKCSPFLWALVCVPMTVCALCYLGVFVALRWRVNRLYALPLSTPMIAGTKQTEKEFSANRMQFLKQVSSGLPAILGMSISAMGPAWTNWIISAFGLIKLEDTTTWFIIAWVLRASVCLPVFLFGIPLVRRYWNCCRCFGKTDNATLSERRKKLRESHKYYMQMI